MTQMLIQVQNSHNFLLFLQVDHQFEDISEPTFLVFCVSDVVEIVFFYLVSILPL